MSCPVVRLSAAPLPLMPALIRLAVLYEWKKFSKTRSRSGWLPRARLDDAVRRILRVKFRAYFMAGKRPVSVFLVGMR